MKGYIFTLFVCYGGAIAALFDPFIGLIAYVLFANLRPEFLWYWAIPMEGNYSRIVAAGLILGWVTREFLRSRQEEPERGLISSLFNFSLRPFVGLMGIVTGFNVGTLGKARIVVASLVMFWFWSVLSATISPYQKLAWDFVDILTKVVLPVVAGVCLIDSMAKLKIIAWTLVLSQGYIAFDMNLSYFEGYNRLRLDGFGGMDNNSASIGLVTALGIAFFLGLYSPKWWQKGLAFGSAACMGHAVLFSMSRGGVLAMIVTGVILFLLIKKSWMHYLALGLAVLLGLRLAGPEVRERFMTIFAKQETRDESADSRLRLWSACWKEMQRNPVFGLGPDHWPTISDRYGFFRGKEAHTLWLQIGAELGFPGLGFLVLFYASCMIRLWPLSRFRLPEGADPWLAYLAGGVIASLVGFAVSAQFVSLKLLEIPYYMTMLGAGVLKLASAQAEVAVPRYTRNVLPVPGAV